MSQFAIIEHAQVALLRNLTTAGISESPAGLVGRKFCFTYVLKHNTGAIRVEQLFGTIVGVTSSWVQEAPASIKAPFILLLDIPDLIFYSQETKIGLSRREVAGVAFFQDQPEERRWNLLSLTYEPIFWDKEGIATQFKLL